MSPDSPQEQGRTAAQVAEHCPLSEEAQALLTPELAPGTYLAQLISQEKYADAIRFAAFSLPKRKAIWWGTLCLWDAYRVNQAQPLPRATNQVFEALIAWLQNPSEPHRRAVEAAGREAGTTAPHGQLAMAAFFSEGSISVPDQPEVDPKPWLTAKNVAAAVLAASRLKKPPQIAASQRSYLVLAAEQAEGRLPCEAEEGTSAPVAGATNAKSHPHTSRTKHG